MQEILYSLPADALVLDIACGGGSFQSSTFPFRTVRADLTPHASGGSFVQADAAALPFPRDTFDAVVCNHGLEHFENPGRAMQEMGRVVKRSGALFVSVPDARTLHDRLYRFVAKGGGHVNFFTDPQALARSLEWYSGLPHVATKVLGASFAFLNKRNLPEGLPLRYRSVARRWETPLLVLAASVRTVDRLFGTRASVYGWGFYLGTIAQPIDTRAWKNLCMRCGQAHDPDWLQTMDASCRKWLLLQAYRCPGCGAVNLFSR